MTYPIIRMTLADGSLMEFKDEQIIRCSVVEESNPISIEIPVGVIEFTVINNDPEFSMFSDTSSLLVAERLPLLVYEKVGNDEKFIGKYYLEKWKNLSETEIEFRAFDIVGVLDKTVYDGGFWEDDITVENIFAQLFDPLSIPYRLTDAVKTKTTSGWIPPSTYREALQQICFGAGLQVSTARSNSLEISNIKLPVHFANSYLPESEKLMKQEVDLLGAVTGIELISHDYYPGESVEEIFQQYLEPGTHKVVFDRPMVSIVVDGPGYTPKVLATEDGQKYVVTEGLAHIEVGGGYSFGANSLNLTMAVAGTVTITGIPWVDGKQSVKFKETGLSQFANKNELKIADATMVNRARAQEVLNTVRDYYRLRYGHEVTLIAPTQKTGEIVYTEALFSEVLIAKIEKMLLDMSGGYLVNTFMVGALEAPFDYPRYPRTKVAVTGADLTRQNLFRND